MTDTRRFRRGPILLSMLVLTCLIGGQALAGYYLPDGTKPDGPGAYKNPGDGICVVGIKLDGTMLVDWSITKSRDCVAWSKSEDGLIDLAGLDTSDKCTKAGFAGNDGWKHTWSTSVCWDATNNRAISRIDLDNTAAMCTSKGGTVVTSGKCVAYGWVYINRKADGTLPISGTGISETPGVQAADDLGFCYTAMRETSATFTSSTTCPSKHNSRATADPVGGPYTEWLDCLSNTNGCQTQVSYDAGLGWSWDGTNNRCNYNYGVNGVINAAATKADGTQYAAGSTQDLTVYTAQGLCLANGFSWDNWLAAPTTTVVTNASGGEWAGLPAGAVIRRLDALTPVKDGGGNFISGTGSVCQKCHADQSRGYQERDKPGYPETRHKLAGDATGKPFQPYFTAEASAWGLKGVQCNICHSTARAAQDDLLQVVPAGLTNAGNPKSATGHNQTEYGAHVNGVCYGCHGTATNPATLNPAANIPVAQGDFALTAKGLAPISNQFLNSPHAQYTGTSAKVDVGDRTKYGSTFIGYVCRTSNSIGGGSIVTTVYRDGQAERIHNVDSATNTMCTNPGDGTPDSGAAGYWVKEGEAVNGGTPPDTAQGNCMTCHDVHWALDSQDPKAEPIRRECTTCHSNGGTSASGAPQIDIALVNHLATRGTPLENVATEPNESCEVCHMPPSGSGDASRAHLWRINTDAGYRTMGYNKANLTNDGNAWVDLDLACGQCHGGGEGQVETSGTIAAGSAALHVASAAGLETGDTIRVAGAGAAAADLDSRIVSIAGSTVNLADRAATGATDAAVLTHPTKNDAPYYTTEAAAAVAKGMHDNAGVSYPVTFTYTVDVLTVDVVAQVSCGANGCPTFTYDWNWGDGTPHGTLEHDAHTYATSGTKTITLVVRLASNGGKVGDSTRSLTLQAPDLAPEPAATCTWDANTWTMTLVDASHDDGPDGDADAGDGDAAMRVTVDWGDGSVRTPIQAGATTQYVYKSAGTFGVSETAVDSKAQAATATCATEATPAYFVISGTVRDAGGNPVPLAIVRFRKGSVIAYTTRTASDGTFTTGDRLRPGTYNVDVTRTGYRFATPALVVTVGPSSTGNTIVGSSVRLLRNNKPRR